MTFQNWLEIWNWTFRQWFIFLDLIPIMLFGYALYCQTLSLQNFVNGIRGSRKAITLYLIVIIWFILRQTWKDIAWINVNLEPALMWGGIENRIYFVILGLISFGIHKGWSFNFLVRAWWKSKLKRNV